MNSLIEMLLKWWHNQILYLKTCLNLMGHVFKYQCENCGYNSSISGGHSRGFVMETQTGVCTTCNELVDFPTYLYPRDKTAQNDDRLNRCPRCKSLITQHWEDGDPCPRCKGKVIKGDFLCHWD